MTTSKKRLSGRIKDAQNNRGNANCAVISYFCSSANETRIVFGQLEFYNALRMDGDRSIASHVLRPPSEIVSIAGDNHKTEFDALIQYVDGHWAYREVSSSLDQSVRKTHQREAQEIVAKREGRAYERFTGDDLHPHSVMIRNWAMAIGYMGSTNHSALATERFALTSILSTESISVADLLRQCQSLSQTYVLAALFRLYKENRVDIDLESQDFGMNSTVSVGTATTL